MTVKTYQFSFVLESKSELDENINSIELFKSIINNLFTGSVSARVSNYMVTDEVLKYACGCNKNDSDSFNVQPFALKINKGN